jgi:hypothetical protein
VLLRACKKVTTEVKLVHDVSSSVDGLERVYQCMVRTVLAPFFFKGITRNSFYLSKQSYLGDHKMSKASLEVLDQIGRQLTHEQSQLDSKAAQLMDAQQKLNEIKALLTTLNDVKGSPKRKTKSSTNIPSASELRMFVRKVLTKRKTVPGGELMVLVHENFNITQTRNVNDSPISARTYQALKGLQTKGYVRRLGKNKRTLSATSRGLKTKSWG